MYRKSTPASSPTPAPAAEPAPVLHHELMPFSALQRSPTTRDEIAVRDEVRKQLNAIEDVVVHFVAAKEAEGFSRDEAFQLYSSELPPFFAYAASARGTDSGS